MAEEPTDIQARVASALSVKIAGDSRRVAAARLHDAVAEAIGSDGFRPATQRQVAFARSLNLDVCCESLRVASARIADELDRRNRQALAVLHLEPGDRVVVRKAFEVDGHRDEWVREFTVSSIDARGRLYFKGGNGEGAWPTQVEKVSANKRSV